MARIISEVTLTVQIEDTFTPPVSVQRAALRGLELAKDVSEVDRARGLDLSAGRDVSLATVKRMAAFFDRESFEKNNASWLLWGGDAGKRWAESILKKSKNQEQLQSSEEDATKRNFEVAKVDDELGLVFGFAIVSKINGEEYFDVQGDHIPEEAMLEASLDFMENSGAAKEMHQGDRIGSIVFAFPLTSEIARSMNIQTEKTGLMIALKPYDDEVLNRFKSGEYTGFSIGGRRVEDEEVRNNVEY